MNDEEYLAKEFDFSKAVKNPYVKSVKKPTTINLDDVVISYFKEESNNVGVPYQTLINMYLRDCATKGRHLVWS